jgi:hypothetical protein
MLELAVLGATALVALGASGWDARRRRVAARTLERYAISRGHRFYAGERREGPRAVGAKAEVAFTIDLCKLGGALRTRVAAAATTGSAPRLSIFQRTARPAAHVAGAAAGVARFDALYRLDGDDALDGPAVVAPCVAPLLRLAPRASVWLASDGAKITLTWRGIEADPSILDAAVDAVVAAAALHAPRRPYR